MSKYKLATGDLTETFFEDASILGLVAPVSDYQMCWHLNNALCFDFRNNPDLTVPLRKKNLDTTFYFRVAEYRERYTSLAHYLYNNQFAGEQLLPEFKQLDYVWLMKGDMIPDSHLNNLAEIINAISCVRMVIQIAPQSIKNKNHLIF